MSLWRLLKTICRRWPLRPYFLFCWDTSQFVFVYVFFCWDTSLSLFFSWCFFKYVSSVLHTSPSVFVFLFLFSLLYGIYISVRICFLFFSPSVWHIHFRPYLFFCFSPFCLAYTFPSVFVVFNLILLIIMCNWCNVNYEYIYLKEYFNSFTKNYNGDMYRNLFNIHFAIIFACHIKNNTRTSSSHLKAEVWTELWFRNDIHSYFDSNRNIYKIIWIRVPNGGRHWWFFHKDYRDVINLCWSWFIQYFSMEHTKRGHVLISRDNSEILFIYCLTM